PYVRAVGGRVEGNHLAPTPAIASGRAAAAELTPTLPGASRVETSRARDPLPAQSARSARAATRGGHAPEQLGQSDPWREPLDHPRRDLDERQQWPYGTAALDHLWAVAPDRVDHLVGNLLDCGGPDQPVRGEPLIKHALVHALA